MTEMGDAFREHREHVRRQKESNRRIADAAFEESIDMAHEDDMELIQISIVHYQLTVYLSHDPLKFWLYNLYPGNQRIYADPNHRGPYLKLSKVGYWKFENIIVAAGIARKQVTHELMQQKP